MVNINGRKYDIVIIGSGIGGLTAGSLLANRHKVLVLEKNNNVGGYCASFDKGEFKFEVAVQAINGLYKDNPIYEILRTAGALKNTEIVQPKTLYRAIFPDHDIVVPQTDVKGYKKLLSKFFPEEDSNIDRLFNVMTELYNEMKKLHVEKLLKKSPLVLKYGKMPLKFLLDEFIKDDKLKSIIAQYWIYRGLPPSKLAATAFSYIWHDYTVNGSYYFQNGMSGVIENLIKNIRVNKGEVICNAEVCKLNAEGRKIVSVELSNGEIFYGDTFISNMDVSNMLEMIDGYDSEMTAFAKELKDNALSISAFKIYLGIDKDMRDSGIDDYEIFLNPSYNIEDMYGAALNNDLANAPCSITIYSNLSSAFCPSGKSVMSIGVLSGYDYWKYMDKHEYVKNKERIADIVLSRCEKALPGFSEKIALRIVSTPLTMERYTGNARGSIYGWNKKSMLEEIKFMSPTTPMKNLYLSSHWTKIGGGVAGVLLSTDRVFHMLNCRTKK